MKIDEKYLPRIFTDLILDWSQWCMKNLKTYDNTTVADIVEFCRIWNRYAKYADEEDLDDECP